MRRFTLLSALIVALLLPGYAWSEGQRLTGAEITAMFTGNTVAGSYLHGGYFSEFHAEDGRALGDNGLTLNTDACWNVDDNRVCYHYGLRPDRRTYCFFVERDGDKLNLRVSDTGRLNAIGSMQKGNPSQHSDGGKRWSCDDLLSSRQRVILPASFRR
jgi:hypothetical protein